MSYCCNPVSLVTEFPIVDKNFPDIDLHKCLCQDYEEICKLKQKIICEFLNIIHRLNCGILPNLEFLLLEISLIYIINNEGSGVEISDGINYFNDIDKFYIGAGTNYEDILHSKYLRLLDSKSYDVIFELNDNLFMILPANLDYKLQRADMNGYEIPFNKELIDDYVVYTSKNKYNAGTYNIDITYGNTILS